MEGMRSLSYLLIYQHHPVNGKAELTYGRVVKGIDPLFKMLFMMDGVLPFIYPQAIWNQNFKPWFKIKWFQISPNTDYTIP